MQSCNHMYTNNIPPPPATHTHTHTHTNTHLPKKWRYWYISRMTRSNMRRHLCGRLKYGVLVDIFFPHHQLLQLHDTVCRNQPKTVYMYVYMRYCKIQPTHSACKKCTWLTKQYSWEDHHSQLEDCSQSRFTTELNPRNLCQTNPQHRGRLMVTLKRKGARAHKNGRLE